MRLVPNRNIAIWMVENTPSPYPLCETEKDALEYLKILINEKFCYGAGTNFDIVDYKKLFYIECSFPNNKEIQKIIKEIKENVTYDYAYNHKMVARYLDKIPDIDRQNRELNMALTELCHFEELLDIND